MMNFMREGGFPMWVMVAALAATVTIAFVRPRAFRARTLGIGAIVQLGIGLFGTSLGLAAVSKGFQRFPDHVEALGIGIGEVANNGILAGGLALALGLAALVSAYTHDHEARA